MAAGISVVNNVGLSPAAIVSYSDDPGATSFEKENATEHVEFRELLRA